MTERFRRYLHWWLVGTVVVVASVCGLNALVDPYGLVGAPRWPGVNAVKSAAGPKVRTAKPYQLRRVQPHTVVVGNSRPEMGIRPLSDCWAAADRPVFNFAQPGLPFVQQAAAAKFAIAVAPVRRIFFGIDFVDFVTRGDRPYFGSPIIPPRLLAHRPRVDQLAQSVRDHFAALLSVDALVDSLRTLALQHSEGASDRTPLGFNPARDLREAAEVEGQHALFAQKLAALRRWLVDGGARPVPEDDARWRALHSVLQAASEQRVDVVLFVNPYHAEYLDVLREAGLASAFLQWKKQLAQAADDFNTATLWDFAVRHRYTTEPVPAPGVKGIALRWFWEPAHYRAELGEVMLAQMTGRSCAAVGTLAFGRLLVGARTRLAASAAGPGKK